MTDSKPPVTGDGERLTKALRRAAGVRFEGSRGELVNLCEQAANRIAVLESALWPFADASADCDDPDNRDSACAWESGEAMHVTIGHFRQARAALSKDNTGGAA